MALDLSICKQECFGCIKGYKKKHGLRRGGEFEIRCNGIPDLNSDPNLFHGLSEKDIKTAKTVLDPVAWAIEVLDWHCLDPDGEIWKRKNPAEYYDWKIKNPDTSILGHSRYHRPYQAEMLRCTSKRKVFRVGRQAGKCLPSGTLIQMGDGTQKPIELVNNGDIVVSVTDNYKVITNSAFRACNGEKPVLQIELMDGREIEATVNHPFLSR